MFSRDSVVQHLLHLMVCSHRAKAKEKADFFFDLYCLFFDLFILLWSFLLSLPHCFGANRPLGIYYNHCRLLWDTYEFFPFSNQKILVIRQQKYLSKRILMDSELLHWEFTAKSEVWKCKRLDLLVLSK